MKYVRPMVLVNEDLAEGVYAASGAAEGGSCQEACAQIVGGGKNGEGLYRITIDGEHHGVNHKNDGQVVTLTFNKPVTVVRSSASKVIQGDGTTIRLEYRIWHDVNYNSQLEQWLYLSGDDGLSILSATATDSGFTF